MKALCIFYSGSLISSKWISDNRIHAIPGSPKYICSYEFYAKIEKRANTKVLKVLLC